MRKEKIMDRISPDEIIRGRIKVEWENISEGYDGNFDEEDGFDTALLRFYTSVNIAPKGEEPEWKDIQDGSYCTLFPVDSTPNERQKTLILIMDRVYDKFDFVDEENSGEFAGYPDKDLEILSHISPDWL